MTGGNSVEETSSLHQKLLGIMKAGQLEMTKWTSNHSGILENFPSLLRSEPTIHIDPSEAVKTLGLYWTPSTDTFSYRVNLSDIDKPLTKRLFLSDMAKTFDPIGFLSPIIIKPKILFQQIWKLKCEWDDLLPSDICEQW